MTDHIKPVKAKVLIEQAIYPLLHKKLSAIPERMRAEKIRQLATLGLLTETNGLYPSMPTQEGIDTYSHQETTPAPQEIGSQVGDDIGEDFATYN